MEKCAKCGARAVEARYSHAPDEWECSLRCGWSGYLRLSGCSQVRYSREHQSGRGLLRVDFDSELLAAGDSGKVRLKPRPVGVVLDVSARASVQVCAVELRGWRIGSVWAWRSRSYLGLVRDLGLALVGTPYEGRRIYGLRAALKNVVGES